ncbi:MAG: LytTR family transcriptional regulator [Ruminococcaceae bacterium]|nr:LytTR family transcriptional regulator [Oscillospiraceae bacterium]
MQVEVKIDPLCENPKVIIITDKMTQEINDLVKQLTDSSPQIIVGQREDSLEILEQSDIVRIYSASGKIFAVSSGKEYILRQRLYELEERLDKTRFARISNSEIINLRKVKKFDMSLSGTICVLLSDGTASYVSRRYVAKIKQILGI